MSRQNNLFQPNGLYRIYQVALVRHRALGRLVQEAAAEYQKCHQLYQKLSLYQADYFSGPLIAHDPLILKQRQDFVFQLSETLEIQKQRDQTALKALSDRLSAWQQSKKRLELIESKLKNSRDAAEMKRDLIEEAEIADIQNVYAEFVRSIS